MNFPAQTKTIERNFSKTTQISVIFLRFQILKSRHICGFHCTSRS